MDNSVVITRKDAKEAVEAGVRESSLVGGRGAFRDVMLTKAVFFSCLPSMPTTHLKNVHTR